jgi:hypothetical protein
MDCVKKLKDLFKIKHLDLFTVDIATETWNGTKHIQLQRDQIQFTVINTYKLITTGWLSVAANE